MDTLEVVLVHRTMTNFSLTRKTIGTLLLASCFILISGASTFGDDLASSEKAAKSNNKAPKVHGGQWHNFPTEEEVSKMTGKQREQLEKLHGIAYLSAYKKASKLRGVTILNREKAYRGLNLVVSGHAPEAILMDMRGEKVHSWYCAFQPEWDPDPDKPSKYWGTFWRRVHLFENGDILGIYNSVCMVRLDNDSNVLWTYPKCHHDVDVAEDGTIYVLTQKRHPMPELYPNVDSILEDFITILTPDGKEIKTFSLIDSVTRSSVLELPKHIHHLGDIFHTNTIEWLDGRCSEISPVFAKGNLLVCFRALDIVAIIDPIKEEVVWATKGNFRGPHQPVLLENGNMLIFDNEHGERPSKVLEFDPLTKEDVWICDKMKGQPFKSLSSSSCQRLPNGNTLITVTEPGYAFSVTPDQEVVWQYYSTFRSGKDNALVASLFEIVRLPFDFPTDWLER